MTHRLSFSNSWRYHPSVHRDGTASTWNLFLMPLLLLLLLLLLEMAGTCYIITEGGKTHTFQQYLSTDRKHSNHFKLGDLSGLPEASQNSQTGSWSGSQAASESDRQSHLSALCRSLISHYDHQRPSLKKDLCHRQCKKREEKHPCDSPLVHFMWGLAEFLPIKIVHKHSLVPARKRKCGKEWQTTAYSEIYTFITSTLWRHNADNNKHVTQLHV